MQIEDGLEAFTLRIFTKVLGWEASEVQVLLALVRKDLRNPSIHAQFDLYVRMLSFICSISYLLSSLLSPVFCRFDDCLLIVAFMIWLAMLCTVRSLKMKLSKIFHNSGF